MSKPNEATFTKGPWGIFDGTNVMAGTGKRSERCVASCGGHQSNLDPMTLATNEANARLVAACPDLLAACEAAIAADEAAIEELKKTFSPYFVPSQSCREITDKLRAAINKARGG